MRYNPKKHHLPVFDCSGILLVDKPAEWTSFDVVNFLRGRYNIPKVGHCGTLDPAATGLLVLMIGEFTKYSNQLMSSDKVYESTLRLGTVTDSGDLDGEIIAQNPVNVTESQLRETLKSFLGPQMQKPPMVSAVKVGGKKLYELARKGIEVDREPRPIEIFDIDVTRMALPECDFTLHCSKGTYVRTLCSDIGEKLGCGGVLASLRRIRSGNFSIADAVTVDQLKEMEVEEFRTLLAEKLAAFAKAAHK